MQIMQIKMLPIYFTSSLFTFYYNDHVLLSYLPCMQIKASMHLGYSGMLDSKFPGHM